MTDTKTSAPTEDTQEEKLMFFFMATALAIYGTDDGPKQRHVNVLLESPQIHLAKKDLQHMNRSVIARINAENGITPDQIKDVVITNISLLGHMAPSIFHAEPTIETPAPKQ